MEVIVIFLGIALYLIWGEGQPPKKPKPKEEWEIVGKKRVTTIEEKPKPKAK